MPKKGERHSEETRRRNSEANKAAWQRRKKWKDRTEEMERPWQATVSTFIVDGKPYMVLQGVEQGLPTFTVFGAEVTYEDVGDAENGPDLTSSVGPWIEETHGCGHHPDALEILREWLEDVKPAVEEDNG